MRTEQHYCKYCGKPYYYQVSGAGCHDDLNNSQFCPECMEIMLEALKKSGRKQERYYRRLKEITITDEQDKAFRELDRKFEEYKKSQNYFSGAISIMPIFDYEHIVGYNYNRQRFYKCWNEDDESDVIYLTYYLYDSDEDVYLDVYNDVHCSSNDYRFVCSGQKIIKAEDVKPVKMGPPTGVLWYMDPITPSSSPVNNVNDRPAYTVEDSFKNYKKHLFKTTFSEDYCNTDWINKFCRNNDKLD